MDRPSTAAHVECANSNCNVRFRPNNRQQQALAEGRAPFHSRDCRSAAGRVTRACEAPDCGEPVSRRRSEVVPGRPVFCGRACAGAARSKKVTCVCGTCGRPFNRVSSQASGSVYCSRTCYHVAETEPGGMVPCSGCGADVPVWGVRRRRAMQGEPVHCSRQCRKKGARVSMSCASCGTPVERYRASRIAAPTDRVFCSRGCSKVAGHKPRRGKELVCANCQEPYYRSASMAKGSRFCSDICRQDHARASRVTIECAYCTQPVTLTSAQARQGRRFCGRKCSNLARITTAVPGAWHNGKPKKHNQDGYVLVWEPRRAVTYSGWVFEHRLVAEEEIVFRPLTSEEEVDHIDENKANNKPSNLRVLDKMTHQAITASNAKARRRRESAELFRYRNLYGSLP